MLIKYCKIIRFNNIKSKSPYLYDINIKQNDDEKLIIKKLYYN